MNILLIGGEGYIGNVVSSFLLDKGHRVVSFDSLLYKNNLLPLSKIHPNYEFICEDMVNVSKFSNNFDDLDAVVLLAGLVGDPITRKYPAESSKINDSGVKNVIEYFLSKNVSKFILISTCSNYGLITGDHLADEEFELNPLSSYAKDKVTAERFLLKELANSETCGTVLRFATAFGLSPRMRFDLTINEFTRDIYEGRGMEVYDPDTWRPYCHVKDFARLIEVVLESEAHKVSNQIFNAGGEKNNATKRMITEKILEHVPNGKTSYREHGSDPRNYKVDFSKVNKVLGFTPAFSIDYGIKEIIKAIDSKIFLNVEKQKDFFGNYNIEF